MLLKRFRDAEWICAAVAAQGQYAEFLVVFQLLAELPRENAIGVHIASTVPYLWAKL